jgi:hypothetical protein
MQTLKVYKKEELVFESEVGFSYSINVKGELVIDYDQPNFESGMIEATIQGEPDVRPLSFGKLVRVSTYVDEITITVE